MPAAPIAAELAVGSPLLSLPSRRACRTQPAERQRMLEQQLENLISAPLERIDLQALT